MSNIVAASSICLKKKARIQSISFIRNPLQPFTHNTKGKRLVTMSQAVINRREMAAKSAVKKEITCTYEE